MSEPVDRFVARVDAIRAQIDRLPEAAVRSMLEDLADVRRQVLGQIAGAIGFDQFRAQELEARIRDVMARFVERYVTVVSPAQTALYDMGAALATRPLVESGVTFFAPSISRRQLEVARAYQATLVANATAETINDISAILRRGVLTGDSMFESLQKIAGTLDDPGPFASLAARAEAITRTELGRIQAVATQASLEETQRAVPDLRKEWKHSGNPRGREGHMDADGQVRGVNEAFRVRPAPGHRYEDLLYPRDPNASPANVIFCGCLSVPFRAEWESVIEEARREQAAFAGGE